MASRSYRFALRPGWIVGHVLLLAAIVVMVNLGLWQLRRLDERQASNATVTERSQLAPLPLPDTLSPAEVDGVEFRRVEVTGTFDEEHEVLVGYRTNRGLPGYHVITPLRTDSGVTVLVNRGFVPLALAERWPVDDAAPPAGEVTIVGLARTGAQTDAAPVTKGAATPKLPDVDIDAIDAFVPGQLLPIHVELQRPRPAGFPEVLPPLDLSEGPHLSYALQWFSFSAIAAVGWIVVLRRAAGKRVATATDPSVSTPASVIS